MHERKILKGKGSCPGAQGPAAHFLAQVQMTSGGLFRANVLGKPELSVQTAVWLGFIAVAP